MTNNVLKYQQKCFTTYSAKVGIPLNYCYLDGNPVRPLVPVNTFHRSLMILGAYPSARFESRKRRLVPIGDNLGPFQPELYFDGVRVRKQESAYGLERYVLKPLSIRADECWITDLVKVFLFKPQHIANYIALGVEPAFKATRSLYSDYAKKSISFLSNEVALAQPILLITLGEEVARVVANDFHSSADHLLTGTPHQIQIGRETCQVAHVAHPDACRRGEKWRIRTEAQMKFLSNIVKTIEA
jgi:uracil-DNA glycosylase